MRKETSAGFIIRGKDGRYLLGKATKHADPFCWSVFKGSQENNEELINTAIRELKEETGIDIAVDERLNRNISTNYIYSYHLRHKDVYLFLLQDVEGALDNFNFKCSSFWGENNLPEIEDWQWFTLDEMDNNIFPSQRGVAEMLRKRFTQEKN